LRSSHRIEITKVVNQALISDGNSFAVLALFPEENNIYSISIRILIKELQANGIHIIAMLNRDANASLNQMLLEMNCTIIKRRNVGRDFGAYKEGVLWLNREVGLDKIKRLLLINDTLLWMNNETRIVAETLKDDWSTLYLNLDIHTHAQSFYLSFSNEVISNKNFVNFWKEYVPTKFRRHAILYGEIKLSEVLVKAGYRCKPLITSSWINGLSENLGDEASLFSIISSLYICEIGGVTPPGVSSGRKDPGKEIRQFLGFADLNAKFDLDKSEQFNNLIRLINQYCHSAAPHRIGLYLYVLFGMPLKTDIYKCYSLSEIHRCVDYKNREYSDDLLDYLSGKSQQFMEGSRANIKRRKLGEI
jgi:hypothetical protein